MKSRAFNATVHKGHTSNFTAYPLKLARLFEDGQLDYCAVSLEDSKASKTHYQVFVIFNEAVMVKGFKPSDLLEGSWSKARSLTGSRDYCMSEGIHYRKKGVHRIFEFGDWVDAGYNINIKFRKQYQFSEMLIDGVKPSDIAKKDPAGVLLVGLKNLVELSNALVGLPAIFPNEPYYYIGLKHLSNELELIEVLTQEEE